LSFVAALHKAAFDRYFLIEPRKLARLARTTSKVRRKERRVQPSLYRWGLGARNGFKRLEIMKEFKISTRTRSSKSVLLRKERLKERRKESAR